MRMESVLQRLSTFHLLLFFPIYTFIKATSVSTDRFNVFRLFRVDGSLVRDYRF